MEEGVAREDGLAGGILHVETNAILCMTRCVHALNGDITELEGLAMLRRLGHTLAILASNDLKLVQA